jgi:peptidylprolyl isomerase
VAAHKRPAAAARALHCGTRRKKTPLSYCSNSPSHAYAHAYVWAVGYRESRLGRFPRINGGAHAAPAWRVYPGPRIGYGRRRENPFRQEFGMPVAGNTLTLETTQGQVVIDMRPDLAPVHVAHIKKLVGEKFYDGIVFHRVIEGFMAQTGCPHGTGTGGSKYPNLKAEFNAEPHVRGTCSMARAQDVNSANSQFFICFGDARFLDKQYTVWGKVTAGMQNVDKIKRGEPVRDPDRIVSATVG